MKILEIVVQLSSGGIQRFLTDLCNEMNLSHDVTLLILKDINEGINGFYLPEVSDRVHVKCLNFKKGFNVTYLFKVAKAVKEINPDVVHFHECERYCPLVVFQNYRKKILVQTIHNDIKKWYTNWFQKSFFNIYGKLGMLHFVTISKTNFEEFNQIYPSCRGNNTLIYNGRADQKITDEFHSIKQEIDSYKKTSNTIVLLHVARYSEQKHQELLVDSFNNWVSKGVDAILLMIGANYDCEAGLALQKVSNERIHYLGTRSKIANYLACSDAFCLSSHFEGMPISVIEAQMMGVPVLSTDVCGVRDVIQNKKNGLMCQDNSIDDYVAMLDMFLLKKDKLKTEAVSRISTLPFSMHNCAKQYIDLFTQLKRH